MASISANARDPRRGLFSVDHQLFRDTVRRFLERDVLPHHAQWERDGLIPRDTWRKAGAAGILLPMTPQEYGGGGEVGEVWRR